MFSRAQRSRSSSLAASCRRPIVIVGRSQVNHRSEGGPPASSRAASRAMSSRPGRGTSSKNAKGPAEGASRKSSVMRASEADDAEPLIQEELESADEQRDARHHGEAV